MAKDNALALPRRLDIHRDAVHLTLRREDCAGIQGRLSETEMLVDDAGDPGHLRIIASLRIKNRRGATEITAGKAPKVRRDPILIGALRRAHEMVEFDARRLPNCKIIPQTQYARRLIQLAFLAPDIQRTILLGRQPADMNLNRLMGEPLPVDWDEQRELFA